MTKTIKTSILTFFLLVAGLCLFSSYAFAGDTAVTEGCRTLPERMTELQACILCPLFEVILKTDQVIATKAFAALAKSFINVLAVILALFIAYHTLLMVSAFTKQDAPKYIGTLLTQIFKVLIAVMLLSNSDYVYNYVINPLMKAGLEFGLALLFTDASTTSGNNILANFKSQANSLQSSMPKGVIGQDLLASVITAVRLFSKTAAQLPAIGGTLICVSVKEARDILPNFEMLIQGLMLSGFGWMITLSCCFYLLDSVVRFGIFCTLLPFLIASWPFKITAQYTKKGWDIFMNAFFNFVMIGLVITVSSELIVNSIGGGKTGGMQELVNALNGNNVDKLAEMMDISGIDFLVMIACCMFAFKLVGQINELATQMAGGGGGSAIGAGLGKTAAQVGKKVALTAAKAGKAVGGAVYEATGAKDKVDGMKQKAMDGLANVGAKVGLGNKANPGGYRGSGGGAGGGGAGGAGGTGGGGAGGGGAGGGAGGAGGGAGGAGGGNTITMEKKEQPNKSNRTMDSHGPKTTQGVPGSKTTIG